MTCVWDADPACLGDEWDALDADLRQRSLLLATSSLQMLTLNRVGTCPVTIRPCPAPKPCGCLWLPTWAGLSGTLDITDVPDTVLGGIGGYWFNSCAHRSRCAPLSEVDIPGPVGYIASLLIDGQEQDLYGGDWRLDDGHLLVWQGEGASPIPDYQDLSKPDTEPGTWSITYSNSYPVGEDGRIAVAYLALEFARACKPKGKCSLPRGVTSVVRNGVSFNIEAGLFPNGLTGIELVDAFILKWAPAGAPSRSATVYNPRRQAPRRASMIPRPPVSGGSI